MNSCGGAQVPNVSSRGATAQGSEGTHTLRASEAYLLPS